MLLKFLITLLLNCKLILILWQLQIFLINGIFLYSLWKHVFYHAIFITDRLNKVRTKLKNDIKSSKMTFNSTSISIQLKTKEIENIKNQNTERRKPSFTKRIQVENADLYKPVPNKTMTTRKTCINIIS